MLLNNQQITEEIKKEIKYAQKQMKMKTQQPKPMGFSKSSSKGKVHSNTSLPQETREKSNKKPNSTPKRKNEEPQGQQKERNKKIRAEINEKEKTWQKSTKLKAGSLRR